MCINSKIVNCECEWVRARVCVCTARVSDERDVTAVRFSKQSRCCVNLRMNQL